MRGIIKYKIKARIDVVYKGVCCILIGVVLSALIVGEGHSQIINYPEIGKKVPEFEFKKFEGPSKSKLSNSGLKGRYVILDFWSTGCGACIASFPKMNELSEKYKDKLDIVLVGKEEKRRSISSLYKVLKRKNNLNLISAYDSVYFNKFVHSTVPYLVWIDPEGTVKAITNNVEANENNLKKFLSGTPFDFRDASYASSQNMALKVDYFSPLLVDGNGGANPQYLFRSVLYKWRLGMGNGSYTDVDQFLQLFSRNRFQTTRANLLILYRLAYFGTIEYRGNNINPKVIVNCQDSSLFTFNYSGNGIGLYNYSIEIPMELANKERIMKAMQEDLHKYFGFNVRIVNREVPYLALMVSDSKKFSAMIGKTGNEVFNWGPEMQKAELLNFPAENLKLIIAKYLPGKHIIYDEMNIKGFINLSVPGKQIKELSSLRDAIKKFGLDLRPSKKIMRTLIIEDSGDLEGI